MRIMIIVFMLSALLTGCGGEPAPERKIPLVKTQIATTVKSSQALKYPGVVRGRYEKNMAPQTGGRILSRFVDAGSRVKAGDVMFTIDPRDAVESARRGDAAVAAAKSRLDLASADLARYRELYAAGAVPKAALDQYESAHESASAAYESASAESAGAHNALSYTELTSDAAGVVSAVFAEAGQVIAAGTPALSLVEDGALEVEINVPENHISGMYEGKALELSFWALPGDDVAGVVREISPMADSATRTYRVRAAIPEPPSALALGMTASVTVKNPDKSGVVIPLSAVCQIDGDTTVLTVRDGKISQKSIKILNTKGNEVIADGLSDGDEIVTAGAHKLHEGQSVRTEVEEKP